MLTKEQHQLIVHLSNYSVADKRTCLMYLEKSDRERPEYGLRTLKRWGYVTQRKDELYGITTKGLSVFGLDKPYITCGGNKDSRQRLARTSRVAALLWQNEIPGVIQTPKNQNAFIPSQIWRTIRQGITSTARFNGILFLGEKRLVVYHIGDGNMDWQLFAERSLFFHNYGKYDDRATGMLLICNNGVGPEIADNIIRHTMYRRKRLLSNPGGDFYETDKPQKYAKSPIRLHDQYSRAFFTEEENIASTLRYISAEDLLVQTYAQTMGGAISGSKNFWDVEDYPRRSIINQANDLFKYLYLFAHIKDSQLKSDIKWSLVIPKRYEPLIEKYRDQIWVITV